MLTEVKFFSLAALTEAIHSCQFHIDYPKPSPMRKDKPKLPLSEKEIADRRDARMNLLYMVDEEEYDKLLEESEEERKRLNGQLPILGD